VTQTSRGISLFVASFFVAALVDTPAKYLLAHGTPLHSVVFLRYAIALGSLIGLFFYRRQIPQKSRSIRTNLFRGCLLTASTFANFYAVSQLPLALVVSINFAAPLFSCALVPFILHEHVGLRRWAAVLVGFVGVLIIVRPGTQGFQPAMLASLFNAFVVALYQIYTRKVGFRDAPETGLLWVFTVGATVTSLLMVQDGWQMPSANLWPWALVMGTAGLATHILISHALRLAPASVLAPFLYTQIIWMTLSGIVLFGDWPDRYTLLGASIIIASGIYVWHREQIKGVAVGVVSAD